MNALLKWASSKPRALALLALSTPLALISSLFVYLLAASVGLEQPALIMIMTFCAAMLPGMILSGNLLDLVERARRTGDELRRQADNDPMTGLMNRRAFFAAEENWNTTAPAERQSRSVICFDIDHFKTINDSFGHHAGDAVIKHFAAILRTNTRRGDLVARFGGEEFVLQAYGASEREAILIAERIRQMVETTAVVHDDEVIRYSISAGVVTSQHFVSIDDMLREADGLVTQAKSRGRNKVLTDRGEVHLGHEQKLMPVVLQGAATA